MEDVGVVDGDVCGSLRKRKVSSRARAGSSSMQWRVLQRGARRPVMAPWPGPISMTVRVESVAEGVGDAEAGVFVDEEVLA